MLDLSYVLTPAIVINDSGIHQKGEVLEFSALATYDRDASVKIYSEHETKNAVGIEISSKATHADSLGSVSLSGSSNVGSAGITISEEGIKLNAGETSNHSARSLVLSSGSGVDTEGGGIILKGGTGGAFGIWARVRTAVPADIPPPGPRTEGVTTP